METHDNMNSTKNNGAPVLTEVPVFVYKGVKIDLDDVAFASKWIGAVDVLGQIGPVYHIRMDWNDRDLYESWDRMRTAFRSINKSRITRRMSIAGFRYASQHVVAKGWVQMRTDSCFARFDSACTVLQLLSDHVVARKEVTVEVTVNMGGKIARKMFVPQIQSSDLWPAMWRIENLPSEKNVKFAVTISPRHVGEMLGIVQCVHPGAVVLEVNFVQVSCVMRLIDGDTVVSDLSDRHRKGTLSARSRAFQAMGNVLNSFYKHAAAPHKRM